MRSLRVAASAFVLLLRLVGGHSAQEGGATELRGTAVSTLDPSSSHVVIELQRSGELTALVLSPPMLRPG